MIDSSLNALTPFYSASYTRSFLTKNYELCGIDQPKTKGYQTCYSFMYHLHHGQLYFEQASKVPLELKPILFYYGLVQFMKACILTRDPSYPESSQVLAHGVSTRKRKKTNYRFLEDEVKTQKNGLLPHFLDKMFHVKHLDGEKYHMNSLLKQIPEMHDIFELLLNENVSLKGIKKGVTYVFSPQLLDFYHMTTNRFEQYISQYKPYWPTNQAIASISEVKSDLVIKFNQKPDSLFIPPFLNDLTDGVYLLKDKNNFCFLPELVIHYLLLYNLSMICRYETEWWGELIHTIDGNDLPFILRFLETVQAKTIHLVVSFLKGT